MINFLKELSVFDRITFHESTHSYYIDGVPTNSLSVTQLIKGYKSKFNQQLVATRVAKKRKCPIDVVLAEWELNNLYSTTLGSMLHKYIENFYANKRLGFEGDFNGLGPVERKKIKANLPILVGHFHNFYAKNRHILCAKSEIVLGDFDGSKVCGMSDLLGYNTETDSFEILDFKTNKRMERRSKWGDRLYAPFDTMYEGEVNEYTIQLNCYKYFIEKYTNLKIDKLKIVWLNVQHEDFELIELEDIQPQIQEVFRQLHQPFDGQ